uniref:Uncharacterized protein n=1 Tax=Aegilops tauschii subsp. strangulata TaxID=200361 RepID=A0A453IZR8_AEGTS
MFSLYNSLSYVTFVTIYLTAIGLIVKFQLVML